MSSITGTAGRMVIPCSSIARCTQFRVEAPHRDQRASRPEAGPSRTCRRVGVAHRRDVENDVAGVDADGLDVMRGLGDGARARPGGNLRLAGGAGGRVQAAPKAATGSRPGTGGRTGRSAPRRSRAQSSPAIVAAVHETACRSSRSCPSQARNRAPYRKAVRLSSAGGVSACTKSGEPPRSSIATSAAMNSGPLPMAITTRSPAFRPCRRIRFGQRRAAPRKRRRLDHQRLIEVEDPAAESSPRPPGSAPGSGSRMLEQRASRCVLRPLQHGGDVVRGVGGGEKHRFELVGMEVDARLLHPVLETDVLLEVAVSAHVAIVRPGPPLRRR